MSEEKIYTSMYSRNAELYHHQALGAVWKNHKYLQKIGNRYIYDNPKNLEKKNKYLKKSKMYPEFSYVDDNENDPDFSEEVWNSAKNISGTDYRIHKRDDGRWIILEEDMKWVLPEGVDASDPAFQKEVKKFDESFDIRRERGEKWTHKDFVNLANKAFYNMSKDYMRKKTIEKIIKHEDEGTELYHHGIEGQKWGVTNGPPYPLDDDISTGKKLKNKEKSSKKNVKNLSDAELEENLKRMRKEVEYRNLEKQLTEKDKNAVKEFIEKHGNKALTIVETLAVTAVTKKILENIL